MATIREKTSSFIRHASELPVEAISAGTKTGRQILIGAEEGPNFAMRRFIMEPGGGMPPHTNTVEHEQYVLRGRGRIGIGEDIVQVKKDDVVFIPAGMPHWYEAEGNEPFEFLCLVPNQSDHIELLRD